MSTFQHKNSLRTIEAQIVQKLKNNEARPKFISSIKKRVVEVEHVHFYCTYKYRCFQGLRWTIHVMWRVLTQLSGSFSN